MQTKLHNPAWSSDHARRGVARAIRGLELWADPSNSVAAGHWIPALAQRQGPERYGLLLHELSMLIEADFPNLANPHPIVTRLRALLRDPGVRELIASMPEAKR
jgi:hypothetical protein